MKRNQPNPFDGMRASLKAGVRSVSVPQLFETPKPLAARAAVLAEILPGMRVLEPSAGTGRLLEAIVSHSEDARITAIEIDRGLCQLLSRFQLSHNVNGDFLEWAQGLDPLFDRVVMNPPFTMGEDIRHIQAARALLVPGGRLVAFCADGPRQREALMPIAATWEQLEPGQFRGTNVRAALLTINKERS